MVKRRIMFLLTLSMILLVGCGVTTEPQNVSGQEEWITFTDDLGRKISMERPERVAVLVGSFAEMWQLAGGEVTATVDDAWDDLELELAEDTVNIGTFQNLNVEQIFASEPDFVIASSNSRMSLELLETFEASKIPTGYFEVSGFEDYLRVLKVFTEITGRDDLYEKNGMAISQHVSEVIDKSEDRLGGEEGPSVLVLRFSATSVYAKSSRDNVLGEMLANLGCNNIADNDETLLENVSLEHIVEMNPDYIFTVQQGGDTEGTMKHIDSLFKEDAVWSSLSAIKEGRWYHMDKRLYNLKPNARWGEAYEGLEAILSKE